MSEKSTMQLLLEARFQQLAEDREESNEMPTELRQEVFRTLDMIDMFGEITDLFTGKFGSTATEFLDIIENPDDGSPAGDPPRAAKDFGVDAAPEPFNPGEL